MKASEQKVMPPQSNAWTAITLASNCPCVEISDENVENNTTSSNSLGIAFFMNPLK
jgi:hypothetical protein